MATDNAIKLFEKVEEIARETGVSFSKGVAICVYN